MIICLSGFVIAGASPTFAPAPAGSRNDICVSERLALPAAGGGGGGCAGGARYSPHHHQLLHHFAAPHPPPYPGAPPALPPHARAGSTSSSAESVCASPPAPHMPPAGPARVRTLYACLGESEGELSFEPNQIITNVAPSPEPGWLRGTLNGRTGLVPVNYVESLP